MYVIIAIPFSSTLNSHSVCNFQDSQARAATRPAKTKQNHSHHHTTPWTKSQRENHPIKILSLTYSSLKHSQPKNFANSPPSSHPAPRNHSPISIFPEHSSILVSSSPKDHVPHCTSSCNHVFLSHMFSSKLSFTHR